MSHILDALRQAEDERRIGKPVTHSTIAGPLRHARRRNRSRTWLAPVSIAALVIGVAISAWWLLRATPPAPAAEAAPPVPLERPAMSASPAGVDAGSDVPRARVPDAGRIRSVDALMSRPAAETEDFAAAGAPGVPAIEPVDLAAVQRPPSAAAPVQAAPRSEEPPVTRGGVVPLPNPRALEREEIAIDVHVYDPDPARRFILVGGRRYNPGDTLPGNVRLVDIEQDSVVLRHDGRDMRQGIR